MVKFDSPINIHTTIIVSLILIRLTAIIYPHTKNLLLS